LVDGEKAQATPAAAQAFVGSTTEQIDDLGLEDDEAEKAMEADEDATAEAASVLGASDASAGDLCTELAAVNEMLARAEAAALKPDARVEWLVRWIKDNLLSRKEWNDRRLIVFTEWEDTRRWLEGKPVPPRFLQSIAITLGSRPRNSSGNGAATRRPSRFPSCETLESWDERLRVRPTTATGRQNTSAAYGAPTQCNLLRRGAWAAPRPPIAGMHRWRRAETRGGCSPPRPAGAAVGRPPGPLGGPRMPRQEFGRAAWPE